MQQAPSILSESHKQFQLQTSISFENNFAVKMV
jgi:hypothetical protein